MTVTWEECGWQGLTPRVGRCRLPGWDCTVGLVAGDGAALMVDAGSSIREGARLRTEACRLLGGARVTHLALTHPHFDHVFGAAAFAGVEVFGAVGVDGVLSRDGEALRADAVHHGLPRRTPPRPPTSSYAPATTSPASGRSTWAATSRCSWRTWARATRATTWRSWSGARRVPRPRPPRLEVVFCGDLVEESGEPQAGPDAIPSHWPAALDRLLDLGGEDALYVPGHGAVVDAAFVRAQRDALARRFGVSG